MNFPPSEAIDLVANFQTQTLYLKLEEECRSHAFADNMPDAETDIGTINFAKIFNVLPFITYYLGTSSIGNEDLHTFSLANIGVAL